MKAVIKLSISAVLLGLVTSPFANADTNATIDLNTQKFIGGVSELQRDKYFNMHSSTGPFTIPELDYLTGDLDVGLGRGFWSPFSVYAGDAPYPSEASAQAAGPGNIAWELNSDKAAYRDTRYIVTEHPSKIFVAGENPVDAAEWAANYFKYYYNDVTRPQFYEPMNEPFVHAGDFGSDQVTIRNEMAQWFAEIGKKFTEKNIDTKIIGYASAWPSMELWDFGHWNGRMKMFMDVAGPHIDALSIHPYDGVNVTGANNQRSGSNLEAMMDMMETYSHFKWDTVKDFAITEYGGIEAGYPAGYSDIKNVQSVRSINNMLFELLDRQDRLVTSIPFITGKSSWHYNAGNGWEPYGADMLRPDPNSIVNGAPTNFFYTPRINFYKIWSDVKGKRVKALTDNHDIAIHAFVDGSKAWVAMNSLAESNTSVDMNFVNSMGTVTNVRRKLLKIYDNAAPVYQDENGISAPSTVTMIPGETVVLEYTFSGNIALNGTYDIKNHYSDEHLKTITANSAITFNYNGVSANAGASILRMGLGRDHSKSKSPVVKVNGTTVTVPSNWAGGDQGTRDSFFGTIQIPVANSLLQTNNVVTVTFPDSGGRVSSMILEVHNDTSVPANDGLQLPSIDTLMVAGSYTFNVDYTATQSRDIVVEFWSATNWLAQQRVNVPAGAGQVPVTVTLSPPAPGTGYVIKSGIRPIGGDWTTALANSHAHNVTVAAPLFTKGDYEGDISSVLNGSAGSVETTDISPLSGGSQAIRSTQAGSGTHQVLTGDPITLVPGKRYKLSFDYKVITSPGDLTFRIYDVSGWKDWKVWTSSNTNGQWVHKEDYIQFISDGGTDRTIAPSTVANYSNIKGRFVIASGAGGAEVLIDNAKLIEETP